MIQFKNIIRHALKLVLMLILLMSYFSSNAQTDREFWFAAPAITPNHENTPIVFRITSYDKPSTVTIQQPANPNFVPIIIKLPKESTITQDLTSYINAIESKPSGSVINTGIKISATEDISAYYEVGTTRNPEIFPLKGISAKGLDFLIPTQNLYNNQVGLTPPANNGFVIVATEDNTTVDITLSKPDGNGHAAGPFSISLQKGQTYSVIGSGISGTLHLGGTTVKSNKPICITIYDDSVIVGSSWDLVGDQIVPIVNIGTEYIIVRGAMNAPSYTNTDFYYIWATEDGTSIYENGAAASTTTINKGDYYRGLLTTDAVYVTTSKPVYLLQFTGVGTEAAETVLPSIKCTGSSTVSFVRSTNEAFYLNIICKTEDVTNFTLNGVAGIIIPDLFNDVYGSGGWKAARINLANLPNINNLIPNGAATSIANTSGLFHLCFLNGGALTGARLGFFSNYSKVAMAPNITTASCLGGNIQLAAKQLNNVIYTWTGPNGFASSIYNPTIVNASIADSGYYYVQATLPGCGTSTDSVHITINPLPSIQLLKSLDTVCYGNDKQIDISLTGKAPWDLVYSDGINNDTLLQLSNSLTNFKVHPLINTVYQIISIKDSNACNTSATTSVNNLNDTIIVNKLPIPNFSYSTVHCEKSSIQFTDLSLPDIDIITQWNWNMGNGSSYQFDNNQVPSQIYNNWGIDTIKLWVVSSMGCKSDTLKKVITINPAPIVGFTIPNVCLDGGMAVFKDTTNYKNTPTSFTYEWDFNAANVPITPAPTFTPDQVTKASPSVLFNIGGDYLVNLKVTTSDGCVDSLSKPFTINGSNPIANFKVLKDTALCSNEDVIIKDSSWVYPGKVGVLHIFWGDGKDTIINDSKIGNLYNHFYANTVSSNVYNNIINVQAYSGGTCYDDSLTAIDIVRPPSNVSLNANQNFVCIQDSLAIKHNIQGGVAPFSYLLSTDNTNAFFKDSTIYGLTTGNVNISIKVTDAKQCIYQYQNLLGLNLPVLPIAKIIIKDTVICNGDSVTLKGQGADTYKWYNNSILLDSTIIDSLRIGNPGNYSLIVNDGKCNSLPIAPVPILEFSIPKYTMTYHNIACTNGDLLIQTDALDKYKIHYSWDFGDGSNNYLLANPTSHAYKKTGEFVIHVNVTNDYCPKYEYRLVGDTVKVLDPLPAKNFKMFLLADMDTTLNPLKVDSGYTNYQWIPFVNLTNPNIPNPVFRGTENIEYTLLRMDPNSGCKILDIYSLDVSKDVVVNVPSAFTPNHDNLNDVLKIEYGAGVKALNTFTIYNRFGRVIFQTNDITKGWDGKSNGIDQDMDGYTYFINYTTYDNVQMKKTGTIILLR